VSTIALELIAAMIKVGDIGPIHRGEFRKEHCTDAGSESLFDFLSHYRQITDGQGHVPAMSVIKDRFQHINLPETAEVIDLPALVYEARSYRTKLSIQALTEKMVAAMDAVDPIGELRIVRAEFDEIMKDAGSSRDMDFHESAFEILEDYSNKTILKQGLPWPWKGLNDSTQGLHAGEFYIISGRPKSRKTFVALYIAAYMMRYHKLRILFISPEMPPRQIMLRFMAFLAEVHYSQFKKGELDAFEEQQLFDIIGMFLDELQGSLDPEFTSYTDEPSAIQAPGSQGAFIVTKATGQPVTFIEAKIKEHRPHVVIVDSFYRLGVSGGQKYDSDWKALTSVSRLLKDMAMEHEVALIGTHQLNRDAEEKVGTLANLGYSDAIAQDCDMALRVITAKRKGGDRSALYVLGGRETECEGVIIHNEPCNNFGEIEPILPGTKKKLLSMLASEEDAEATAEKEAADAEAAKRGQPKNFGNRANSAMKNKLANANPGLSSVELIRPEDLGEEEADGAEH